MIVLSWNVRGMGNVERRMVIKDVFRSNKVKVALIQESKLSSMTDRIAREAWGGRSTKWICVDAVGSTSGIILFWDCQAIGVLDSRCGEFSASRLGWRIHPITRGG